MNQPQCVMSRADVERMMRERPDVALRIVETLANRLVDMERQLEEVAFKSIAARLASVLLRLAAEAGSDEVAGLTHQDLAGLVGTYRETVTQTLNDFKASGLVEIERKKVILTDVADLENIAENWNHYHELVWRYLSGRLTTSAQIYEPEVISGQTFGQQQWQKNLNSIELADRNEKTAVDRPWFARMRA